MVSSRAWFALAVVGVLGVFYVGAGLHSDAPDLAVERVAHGQEAAARKRLEFTFVARAISNLDIYRAKVPGGWLLATALNSKEMPQQLSTFVPDPEHKWDGNSLP